MKMSFLPWSRVATIVSQNKLALLVGVLLCVVPVAAPAQSVTLAGSEQPLPFGTLSAPVGVAVDSTGDVFLVENGNNSVVELPMTVTGYGPQTTLPFSGLNGPFFIALDREGDVFVTDNGNNRVVELPKTETGYGPQTTLPANGLIDPWGIAVDSKGDVFIADTGNGRVLELPQTGTGYGPQTTLIGNLPHAHGIAVDSAGNLFIANGAPTNNVAELPWTGKGYAAQTVLLFGGLKNPNGVAVDNKLDVFLAEPDASLALEVPKTSTGYGPHTTLPLIGLNAPRGVALDSAGDIFVANDDLPYLVEEVQTLTPINFGSAYACLPGQTDPAPCSTQPLRLTYNLTVSGPLGSPKVLGDFAVVYLHTTCDGLANGISCTVEMTFTPTAAGARTGAVEITDTSGTVLATTPLYGTGVEPPPVAKVSTTYLGFGTIPAGDSKTLPLTVTNVGGGTLTVAPLITGSGSPLPYAITGSTCGAGVTFGNSCTLQVQFSPTSAGTHDDLLTLQTNGTTNPTVNLAGIASAGGLGLSGAPLQFGTVSYGSSAVLPLTITDYGLPGVVTVKTVLNSSSFTVLTTAQNTCQAGVTAGHSCTLPVQFTPNSVGAHNALLTLTPSSGGASLTAELHGSGSGLGVSAPVLQFGNTAYGYTETLTITNVGLGQVRIKTAVSNPNYQVLTNAQNTCQGLRPEGHSCTLPVEFLPTSPGYHYGTVTLTPSAGAAATVVGLEGTAVGLTQSVTFAGSPNTLGPTNAGNLGIPNGIALDSAEDVFLAMPGSDLIPDSCCYDEVVELPWTVLGYGQLTNIPAFPFSGAMATDSAGDVFIADPLYYLVVELPRTKAGYGAQIILPFSGLNSPNGVAVDSAGDVFVSDAGNARVVELPRTKTGYGAQTTVPTGGLYGPIAADGAGDLFILTATNNVVEVPREGTGYGAPSTLPFSGLNGPNSIAVDSAGDVFVGIFDNQVFELPRVGTGYGTQTVFFEPQQGYYHASGLLGVAVDGPGDNLFIANQVFLTINPLPPLETFYGNAVEVQTHSVNFGSSYLCSSGQTPCSTTLALYFRVNDNTTLGTPEVLTGGAPNLDFTPASGSTCTGELPTGSFCAVNVTFSPLALGTRNGTVEIFDGAGTVIATAPIYGVGTGQPVAQVSTTTLQFGQVGFGTTETLPLTVTNAGQGTLILLPSISAPNYTITENTCGAGVTAGKSCTLDVEFSPLAIATDNNVLTLQNNGPTTAAVTLDGVANGLSVGTSPLEFGRVPYGSSTVLQLTVTNIGLPGTVTVATKTSDPSYTVLTTAQNTCLAGITAGQNCTLPVKFTPDSESDHAGTLTLTASAEGAITVVGLDGTGGAGVSFTGVLNTLPFTGLSGPGGIGVDSAGDVFLYDVGNLRVLELPRSATGYGPQTTLLAGSGLQPFDGSLAGLALDSFGDVFITDAGNPDGGNDGQVVVIPRGGNGYGGAFALSIYNEQFAPDGGGVTAQPTGIAVDSLRNIITTDLYNGALVELPWQGTGYGFGNTIGGTTVGGVAVDTAGDVFIADLQETQLWEAPKTGTGYGQQIALPLSGSSYGLAVDNVGNLFVVAGDLVELPSTALGYGPQMTVLTGSYGAVATDSAGNIYVTKGNSVQELQRNSVNFGGANVCTHGAPAPCSQTLTFNYSINSNVTFGAPKILTGGKPNLDFTLGTGSTCTGTLTAGSSCTLNVIFTPLAAGTRNGTVEITDSYGSVRTSTLVSGVGVSPPVSPAAQVSTTYQPFGTVPSGTSETSRLTASNAREER
jgi:sugar lactone lactonase YvrE